MGVGVAAAFAYVLGLALELRWLCFVAKPIPVLVLAFYCWGISDRYGRLLAIGLVFSAAGDLLLEGRGLFTLGLAAFLVAHLTYTAAFWSDTAAWRLPWALPFVAYGLAAFVFLRPGIGEMALPVAVYMAAICAMLWRAAARVGVSPRGAASARIAFAGALLFAASDSLIALDRFHAPIQGVHVPIILLYWVGQLGIALSVRRAW